MSNYLKDKNKEISDVDKILAMIDSVPNFIQQWQEIDQTYKNGFCFDAIPDKVKFEEYKEVNTMYKRFVCIKGNKIKTSLDNPVAVLKMIDKWLIAEPQTPPKGWNRPFVVYVKLSKEWLLVMKKFIKEMLNKSENNKEE